jgi:hypothetical protein
MNNNPMRFNDPSGHMIDNGCNVTGCTGNPEATRHTILMDSFISGSLDQPTAQLPENNQSQITNPVVRGANAIDVANTYLAPYSIQTPKPNVHVLLTYSEFEDGSVSEFEITIINKSDQYVNVLGAEISTEMTGPAGLVPCCTTCADFQIRPSNPINPLLNVKPKTLESITLIVLPVNPFDATPASYITIHVGVELWIINPSGHWFPKSTTTIWPR